jgi:hypothetical protein
MADGNSHLQSLICRAKVFNPDLFIDFPADLHQALVEANSSKRLLNDAELTQFSAYSRARAEACWRDCENFFRVVIYAVAAARPRFSDQQSIDALNELYGLMGVPTEGLAFALNQLSAISIASFEALYSHSPVGALLQDSFNNLRELLFGASVKS